MKIITTNVIMNVKLSCDYQVTNLLYNNAIVQLTFRVRAMNRL